MDALLSDINQAGLGRGLQFELFRPGQVEVKDYYAELPIAIRVSGRYHDIGAFAADVANLSRIVTLHNLAIAPASARTRTPATLSMEATARTYRYLDASRGRPTEEGHGRRPPRPRSEEMRSLACRASRCVARAAGCWRCSPAAAPTSDELQRLDGAAAPRGQAQRAAADAAEEVRPRALRRAARRSTPSARRSCRWRSSRRRGSRTRCCRPS